MNKGIVELLVKSIGEEELLKKLKQADLIDLCDLCSPDCAFLHGVYVAVNEGKTELSDESNNISFNQQEEQYEINFKDKKLIFTRDQLVVFLTIAIDVVGEILPLGSVVDLKKDAFKNTMPIDKIQKMRFVISHRFLYHDGDDFYFPYAGMVYPVGTLGEQRFIHFTAPMIENVVHRGFSDEQDEAFVLLMKAELIGEKEMSSFSFATKEDVTEFQKVINERSE